MSARGPIVLFAGAADARESWRRALCEAQEAEGVPFSLHMEPKGVSPDVVDYLLFAPCGAVEDLSPFTRLKALLSLWAGVEKILALNPPVSLPIVRMVDSGLSEGMTDYVVGHVMRYHLDIDGLLARSAGGVWDTSFLPAPPARMRSVGIMGYGVLGKAVARALGALGFRVCAWRRTEGPAEGVRCHHAMEGLAPFLGASEILVGLLPATKALDSLLNAARLAMLPRGACLINAGRGELLDERALLAALESGHLRHATLDVLREEPPPPDHPFRAHPKITLTPHIASVTRPQTAAFSLVRTIAAFERGETPPHMVNRTLGY